MKCFDLTEIISMISENWETTVDPEIGYDRFDEFRFIPEFVEK